MHTEKYSPESGNGKKPAEKSLEEKYSELALQEKTKNVITDGALLKIVDKTDCNTLFPDTTETTNKSGNSTYKPQSTTLNWKYLLDYYGIILKFNEMTRIIEVHDGCKYGLAVDDPEVSYPLLKDGGLRNGLTKNGADELLNTLGYTNQFHPLKEYLSDVQWDGIDRIELIISAVKTSDIDHFRMVLRPWLVSIIAAVYGYGDNPPRGALVFTGGQNIGKTGTLKRISPPGMFKEGVHLSIGGQGETDSVVNATNSLVVELGEIDTTFRKSEISALKSFIGKAWDEYRSPYGRFNRKYRRQTVYCGSVNDIEFLQDATGNTRFWVVDVDSIDFEEINNIDTLQLWAQIKHLYLAGESWLLSDGEMDALNIKNEDYREKPPIEQAIIDYFDWDNEEYKKCRDAGFSGVTQKTHPTFNFMNSKTLVEAIGFDSQWVGKSAVPKGLPTAVRRYSGMKKPRQMRIGTSKIPKRVWILPPVALG